MGNLEKSGPDFNIFIFQKKIAGREKEVMFWLSKATLKKEKRKKKNQNLLA